MEGLAQALRYTHAAREAALATARELAAPEVADLEAMRAHNATLAPFVVTAEVPEATGELAAQGVAAGLASAKAERASFATNPAPVPPVQDCTNDLISRAVPVAEDEHWD